MQYADVAVAARIGGRDALLTYAIPPALLPQIAPGIVVSVPFRTRQVPGVITRLRAQLERPELARRLRPIGRILSPWPLLGPTELRVRAQLSRETGSPLQTTLTRLLPPPSLYAALPEPTAEQTGQGTRRYLLTDPTAGLARLAPDIDRCVAAGQAVLILAATRTLAEPVFAHPPSSPGVKNTARAEVVTLYEPDGPVASQRPTWEITLGARGGVIVGIRLAALLPLRRPGLIVVIEPDDRQFWEEQQPHYHAARVAELRRALFGADLVGITPLPPLPAFLRRERRTTVMSPPATRPKIFVTERVAANQLNPSTNHLIRDALTARERVLLVVPRSGWAAGLVCDDCQTFLRCPTCGGLLAVTTARRELTCRTCQTATSSARCPRCQSANLRDFGWGSDRWLMTLRAAFPELVLVADEADTPLPTDWQGLVSTPERVSRSLVIAPLVVAIEPERVLVGRTWRGNEQLLRLLLTLRSRATAQLVVETRLSQSPIFAELNAPVPTTALAAELQLRKTHGYPPFGHLVTISLPGRTRFRGPPTGNTSEVSKGLLRGEGGKVKEKAASASSKLQDKLHALFPQASIVSSPAELLLKLPLTTPLDRLTDLRRELPRGARWQVE